MPFRYIQESKHTVFMSCDECTLCTLPYIGSKEEDVPFLGLNKPFTYRYAW